MFKPIVFDKYYQVIFIKCLNSKPTKVKLVFIELFVIYEANHKYITKIRIKCTIWWAKNPIWRP